MSASNAMHPVRSRLFQEVAACWPAALTLKERSRVALNSRSSTVSQKEAGHLLEIWAEQFKVSASDILQCWSEELKLKESDIRRIIGSTAEELRAGSSSEPDWLDTLRQILEVMESEEIDCEQDFGLDWNRRGIATITWPWIRYAKRHAAIQLRAVWQSFASPRFDPESVISIFAKRLIDRLYRYVERTSTLELNVARVRGELHGETQEERYNDFSRKIAQPEFAARILVEYPVLCRLLAEETKNWIRYVCDFIVRLELDWSAIQSEIMSGVDPGLLSAEENAGDTHAGSCAVAILEFESKKKLIYKPRAIEGERLFVKSLRWWNQYKAGHSLQEYNVLDRGRYGWCEYIEANACDSLDNLRKFYYREGALLALGFALRMDDVHSDNIITALDHPVIVDTESLFHVPFPNDMDATHRIFDESGVPVGILPYLKIDADMAAISALTGVKRRSVTPFKVPGDDGNQADDLRIAPMRIPMQGGQNFSSGADRDAGASEFADEVKKGFADAYRLLIKNGNVLLEKLLSDLRGDPCLRFVARPTRLYGLLLRASTHPNLLRNALDREVLFNRLWQISGWRRVLIPHERADLWEGAIPIFARAPGKEELWSSRFEQVPLNGWTSGADAVRSRIQNMSTMDLERHLWTIHTGINIVAPTKSRNPSSWKPDASPDSVTLMGNCSFVAVQIARRLIELSSSSASSLGWMDIRVKASNCQERPNDEWEMVPMAGGLYSGLSGMALFFGYLNVIYKDQAVEKFTNEICQSLLEMVERDSMHTEIGALSGISGVLYSLSHLKRFCPPSKLAAACEKIFETLKAFKVGGSSFGYDITSGSAGVICALLSYHAAFRNPAALALAVQHGEHILRNADELPSGLGWKEMNSAHLTGFAHGAAGIAYSLGCLFRESGDGRFKAVAMEALRFERSTFNEQVQNWRDYRDRVRGSEVAEAGSVAWCAGAPGIGMSRLSLREIWQDTQFTDEIAAAFRTTLKRGLASGDDCICHGVAGNLEFLNDACLQTGQSEWEEEVRGATSRFLQRITRKGFAFEANVERLNLMTGLAGCGYALLRLIDPSAVPSVLLLRPPTAAALPDD